MSATFITQFEIGDRVTWFSEQYSRQLTGTIRKAEIEIIDSDEYYITHSIECDILFKSSYDHSVSEQDETANLQRLPNFGYEFSRLKQLAENVLLGSKANFDRDSHEDLELWGYSTTHEELSVVNGQIAISGSEVRDNLFNADLMEAAGAFELVDCAVKILATEKVKKLVKDGEAKNAK